MGNFHEWRDLFDVFCCVKSESAHFVTDISIKYLNITYSD